MAPIHPPQIRLWFSAVVVAMVFVGGCQTKPNPLLRRHGMDAYNQKNTRAAEQRFSQAIEQDPTDWKSLYYLGRIRLDQGLVLDAQLLLERALVLRSDHPETAGILDALSDALAKRGRIEELHTLLDQAISDTGDSHDYIRKARHLMRLGDVDEAKLSYRKAAFFAPPGDAVPFVALADFYESINDTTNAITALRHALAITPKDQAVHQRLREYGIVPGPTVQLIPVKE